MRDEESEERRWCGRKESGGEEKDKREGRRTAIGLLAFESA